MIVGEPPDGSALLLISRGCDLPPSVIHHSESLSTEFVSLQNLPSTPLVVVLSKLAQAGLASEQPLSPGFPRIEPASLFNPFLIVF